MIDFIWSLGIYNCDKDHRAVEKSDIKLVFFIILGINMLKFSEEILKFICNYFKIVQTFDIYFFMIDFIWSLGIYNCDKDHREAEKSDIKKIFSLI